MPAIKTFVFNAFQVNTYVLMSGKECILIDPACNDREEKETLAAFISGNDLNPIMVLNTHGHVDHLPGVAEFKSRYGIPFLLHKADLPLLRNASVQGMMFGFDLEDPPMPDRFPEEGDSLAFGASSVEVLHVPGHSPGSLVFVNRVEKYMVTGDVLFSGSIGRTDLPGGNYDILVGGIREKLMKYDDEFTVFPGHGPPTTVGEERKHNPFLQ